MAPRYRVTLTVEERSELKALTRAATKTTGKRFLYARALLLCDRGPEGPGWTVARVAEALGVSARTIEHLKRRFVEQGLEFALERKRRVRPPRKVIFDGAVRGSLGRLGLQTPAPPGTEALDPAPACGESSGTGLGRAGVGDDGAADAKKNQLQPHRKKYWRIPPRGSAAFVACMEDVLEVYARPYDPRRPVVCMDETNKQLIGEVREPLPVAPGQPERVEHEYLRNGVAQIFAGTGALLTGRKPCGGGDERRPRGPGLGPVDRGHVGEAIPGGRAGGPGLGQPEHARNRIAVRDLRASTRSPTGTTTEIHYTPEPPALAQHCRNRIERAVRTMPGPQDSKPGRDAT